MRFLHKSRFFGIDDYCPLVVLQFIWERKLDRFPMGIKEQQKAIIANFLALGARAGNEIAIEEQGDRFSIGNIPFFLGHPAAIRVIPVNIGHPPNGLSLKPFAATKYRMLPPEVDEFTAEIDKVFGSTRQIPVKPGHLAILTIPIVVALLRPSQFIATEQHRDSLRQHQRGEKVAALAFSQP